VDYFGPVLLSRARELDFDTQPPPELFGDAPDSHYADASPVKLVSKGDAPFLLVHGDADTLVPVGHAHLMDEELRNAGVPCELFVIPGGGHGDFFRRDPRGEYWKRTERFLVRHLR
jgi:dipeptidyl aminopeptidase/acylaminoacyl peptidase